MAMITKARSSLPSDIPCCGFLSSEGDTDKMNGDAYMKDVYEDVYLNYSKSDKVLPRFSTCLLKF